MTAFRDYGWVLALYVALQIAWTLLIRTFPDFIGGALLKGVERRNAITIEKFKDELSQKTQGEIERLEFLVPRRLGWPEGDLEAPPGAGSHVAGVAPDTRRHHGTAT